MISRAILNNSSGKITLNENSIVFEKDSKVVEYNLSSSDIVTLVLNSFMFIIENKIDFQHYDRLLVKQLIKVLEERKK